MIQALKSLKPNNSLKFPSASTFRSSQLGSHHQQPTTVRFIQATSSTNQELMEQHQDKCKPGQVHCPPETTEDIMSHSFGDGYKTRSDEEGFGGIYGGNKSEDEVVDVIDVNHVLHPEYDKSQGCEVKEKEKARNQMHASS